MMKPYDTALALGQAYEVFGQLLQDGITTDTLALVDAVPDLRETLPDTPDMEQLAAAHYRLFGMDVFPFEAMFLGADNQLGTESTEAVSHFYNEIGWPPHYRDDSPDHIANELALLSFLCWAEADAHEDERPDEAQRMRYWQRRFLNEHLLRWLPAFVMAIRDHDQRPYQVLADTLLDTALSHRAALEAEFVTAAAAFTLPPVTLDLENEKTSLKDITRYLLTTAHSGVYISRADAGALGQRYRVPRGFGSRQQITENLLHSAVRYEAFAALMDELRDKAQTWRKGYAQLAAAHPVMQPIAAIWMARLDATHETLERIKHAAIEDIDDAQNTQGTESDA